MRFRPTIFVNLVSSLSLTVCAVNAVAQAGSPEPSFEPSFGENIGRGFAGSEAEPSFGFDLEPEEAEEKTKVLPPVQELEPQSDTASGQTLRLDGPIDVTDIIVNGNTALAESDIADVVAPFKNRRLKPEYVQELRQRLSLLYYQAGYINSGVIVPEQDFSGGVLRLQVIEGALTQLDLDGNKRLSDEYIGGRLLRNIDQPLNLNDLQDSLRQLELNPLIRRVNGQLLPGLSQGDARLKLRVAEAMPLKAALSVDNYRSPSVGAERAVLNLEHMNLTRRGDRLRLSGSLSEGLNDAFVAYQLPINSLDTSIALQYQRGSSEVVENPFKELDIESDTESWSLSLSHPFINRLNRQFSVTLAFNHSSSETELGGSSFSFSLGSQAGESVTSSISLGAEWVERRGDQVFALRTTLRQGIDALDSTVIPDGGLSIDLTTGAEIPDTRFTAIITQFQYARRLSFLRSQLIFNTNWQESFDPLLSVEKFAVGGAFSVRGFRENQLVRDNGLAASLEWRIPLFLDDNGFDRWGVQLIPFIDYGRSWDEDSNLATHDADSLSSAGLGVTWNPFAGVGLSLFYGERIDDDAVTPAGDHDLQDDGLHFSLRFSWPFR